MLGVSEKEICYVMRASEIKFPKKQTYGFKEEPADRQLFSQI